MPSTFAAPDARFAARLRRSRVRARTSVVVVRRARSGRRPLLEPPPPARPPLRRVVRALPRSAIIFIAPTAIALPGRGVPP
ncbi:hypothetical protein [Amycolatopsis keratiniphila]|uniref:hypothetical protein n=1 Tax=Amycolatopsis keratiniphila TaxID=129921 RepID=UPI00117830A7|nr:hypothetical protein [Amycolatopsis keratiniphila]